MARFFELKGVLFRKTTNFLRYCIVVTCRRPRMAGSVTEAWSHNEGWGGRSVTGVHGSVTGAQNKRLAVGHGNATSAYRI